MYKLLKIYRASLDLAQDSLIITTCLWTTNTYITNFPLDLLYKHIANLHTIYW